MRNYIILNEVNSNTVTGLLISELPPITKPKMRTQTEEIDGRDGDIITKLGYSAYTKTIEIGLYGNYDVNEVIKYFNSEAEQLLPTQLMKTPNTIVFSNEPDKVYYYEMLDQIDFDRLIRFKKAKVRLHVQPFKYLLNETIISGTTSLQVTNTGNIYAKPEIMLIGTGTVNISLDNEQIFTVDLTENGTWLIIDTASLEAYALNTSTFTLELANRQVTGDYSNFKLTPGTHTITFSGGSIEESSIQKYNRWL